MFNFAYGFLENYLGRITKEAQGPGTLDVCQGCIYNDNQKCTFEGNAEFSQLPVGCPKRSDTQKTFQKIKELQKESENKTTPILDLMNSLYQAVYVKDQKEALLLAQELKNKFQNAIEPGYRLQARRIYDLISAGRWDYADSYLQDMISEWEYENQLAEGIEFGKEAQVFAPGPGPWERSPLDIADTEVSRSSPERSGLGPFDKAFPILARLDLLRSARRIATDVNSRLEREGKSTAGIKEAQSQPDSSVHINCPSCGSYSIPLKEINETKKRLILNNFCWNCGRKLKNENFKGKKDLYYKKAQQPPLQPTNPVPVPGTEGMLPAPDQETNRCPRCGAAIQPGQQTCSQCGWGAAMEEPQMQNTRNQPVISPTPMASKKIAFKLARDIEVQEIEKNKYGYYNKYTLRAGIDVSLADPNEPDLLIVNGVVVKILPEDPENESGLGLPYGRPIKYGPAFPPKKKLAQYPLCYFCNQPVMGAPFTLVLNYSGDEQLGTAHLQCAQAAEENMQGDFDEQFDFRMHEDLEKESPSFEEEESSEFEANDEIVLMEDFENYNTGDTGRIISDNEAEESGLSPVRVDNNVYVIFDKDTDKIVLVPLDVIEKSSAKREIIKIGRQERCPYNHVSVVEIVLDHCALATDDPDNIFGCHDKRCQYHQPTSLEEWKTLLHQQFNANPVGFTLEKWRTPMETWNK